MLAVHGRPVARAAVLTIGYPTAAGETPGGLPPDLAAQVARALAEDVGARRRHRGAGSRRPSRRGPRWSSAARTGSSAAAAWVRCHLPRSSTRPYTSSGWRAGRRPGRRRTPRCASFRAPRAPSSPASAARSTSCRPSPAPPPSPAATSQAVAGTALPHPRHAQDAARTAPGAEVRRALRWRPAITAWASTTWCWSRKTTSSPRAPSPPPSRGPAHRSRASRSKWKWRSLAEFARGAGRCSPTSSCSMSSSWTTCERPSGVRDARGQPGAGSRLPAAWISTRIRGIAATGMDFISVGGAHQARAARSTCRCASRSHRQLIRGMRFRPRRCGRLGSGRLRLRDAISLCVVHAQARAACR